MAVTFARPEIFERTGERNNSSSYLRFPDSPNPHSILLVFKNYDFSGFEGGFGQLLTANRVGSRSSGIGLRGSNSVELPFPKQLVDGTNLRLNNFERDKATEQVAQRINNFLQGGEGNAIGDIPGMIQQLGAGLSSLIGEGAGGMEAFRDLATDVLGTDVSDAATAAQYLLRSKLPGDISRSIDLVTGQTINPRETLAFEGVNLRTHQFNWDLYPSNEGDSERIREIVQMIKRNSLPGVSSIAGIPKAFLQYPSTVDMYLIGVNREHYMKFKTSMINSFTVDYGANGMAFMKGGKPASVNLSIQLTELEIETAEDYGAPARTTAPSNRRETADEVSGSAAAQAPRPRPRPVTPPPATNPPPPFNPDLNRPQ